MAAPSPRDCSPHADPKFSKARRSHTKSRNGCFECKRRHIKCSEKHPTCANCRVSERQCVYPERCREARGASPAAPRKVSQNLDGVTKSHGAGAVPAGVLTSVAAAEEDVTINMLHMELLHHFSNDTFVPEMGQDLLGSSQLVIEAGIHAPYLMYETLAISARHLACLRSPMRHKYLHQAMKLQTQAISMFNTHKHQLDKSSSVARLLFSSVLGRHLLSDTLANRESTFEAFLEGYLKYARLHRGLKAITADAWPFLKESELEPAISWGTAILDMQPRGHHCDGILRLLSSANLDDTYREACQTAVHFLQVGFDEVRRGKPHGRSIHVMFWWSILVPDEYLNLLEQRRPEAVLILGYYAALLQCGKEIWLIGDAGAYLIMSITHYLGSEWAEWLAWPRDMLVLS